MCKVAPLILQNHLHDQRVCPSKKWSTTLLKGFRSQDDFLYPNGAASNVFSLLHGVALCSSARLK